MVRPSLRKHNRSNLQNVDLLPVVIATRGGEIMWPLLLGVVAKDVKKGDDLLVGNPQLLSVVL